MMIPKDTTVCYENLTTNSITVRGHLKVTGILTAKHIQGDGYIEAGEVVCDTLEIHTLRAEIATVQRLVVKKLFVRDCRAADAVVATDFAESASLQTQRLTVTMFNIGDLKAGEIIVLPRKNRGMLGTLFAAWLRTLFSRPPKEKESAEKPSSPPKDHPQALDSIDQLTDQIIQRLEQRGYFLTPQLEKAA